MFYFRHVLTMHRTKHTMYLAKNAAERVVILKARRSSDRLKLKAPEG
jgi:hypothetical protein